MSVLAAMRRLWHATSRAMHWQDWKQQARTPANGADRYGINKI